VTESNGVGVYTVPLLQPGMYRVLVQAAGFQGMSREGIKLDVDEDARLDFTLEVGKSEQTITVSAETAAINTEDASVSTVVERQVVANMPLNGRSFQGLITLTPGVATVAANTTATAQFVVNGQRSDTSYFSVDGVSANVAAPPGGTLSANGTGSAHPPLQPRAGTTTWFRSTPSRSFACPLRALRPNSAARREDRSLWFPASARCNWGPLPRRAPPKVPRRARRRGDSVDTSGRTAESPRPGNGEH